MLSYSDLFKEAKKFSKEVERWSTPVLEKQILEQSLFVRGGTLPVFLTVPHDGVLDSLAGVELNHNPNSRKRDVAVRLFARDTYVHMLKSFGVTPSLVIQRVHREFITYQVQTYFENSVINSLREASKGEQQPTLLLDLHGFARQPEFGEYDMILGTDHRRTVGDSGVDYDFAEFMSSRGYCVYLPGTEPILGERYGATQERTLVNKVTSSVDNVVSFQVEISSRFRQRGAIEIGQRLSRDIGDFLVNWLGD